MAKKGTTIRVFQLAKELGVTSKDIVAKCHAEQIPDITNHMSAVRLGLAATIREWFGESQGVVTTAVETAAPVDVAAARAKVKRKASRKKAAKKLDPAAAAVAEPRAEPAPKPAAAPPVLAPVEAPRAEPAPVETPEPIEAPLPLEPLPLEAPPVQPPEKEAPAIAAIAPVEKPGEDQVAPTPAETEGPGPIMNVPMRPEVIAPAGPKLQQPVRTKLAGPKVIRVESPEIVPSPGPRRVARGGNGPAGRGGPRGGRGVEPIAPRGSDVPGVPLRGGRAATSRRNKRRSASAGRETSRTGRSASVGTEGRPFNWREQDLLERERRLNRSAGFLRAARRDNLKRSVTGGQRALTPAEAGGTIKIEEPITIKSLSAASGVKVNDITRQLVKSGKALVHPDTPLENEVAMDVMLEFGVELEITAQKSAEEQIIEQFKERQAIDEQPRSPVVTILGHVDHGKTTLLDRIRHANVAAGEAGGITQATSAFRVPVALGQEQRLITFIDTPGHEAFTEMRSRGAKVTDIVVLVVAADDGVMPQTVESINHARAAGVPILVALNKIDKPEATDTNLQRVLGQLADRDLNPVAWGGSTEVVRVSAVDGEGVEELLETLDYQAQLLELVADFGGPAEGTVIEAQLEEGRGPVARILVQQGQLSQGDFIVAGRAYGRVRDIVDDKAQRIKSAGPSTPVAVSGINEVPDAGDKFYVVKNLREAEAAADERRQHERERGLVREKVTLDNIFQKLAESERKELPLIVKADVQGSLETLISALSKIGSTEVTVEVKHAAVGGVNESDIALAEASGAIVIGFNVTAASAARKAAEARGVDVRFYDVIYDLTDDVTRAAEGLLEPELKLEVLGHAEVRNVFKISKVGAVAGCYVTDGAIERNAQIRVTRDEIVIEKDRRLEQLKHFKEDTKEVKAGQECGMHIEGYDDIRVGDVLECYKTLQVRRTLQS